MAKLLDRVLQSDCYGSVDPMWNALSNVPAIDITNVTEYFDEYYSGKRAFYSLCDAFVLAPPFEHFWIESKPPKKHYDLLSFGFFCMVVPYSEVEDEMRGQVLAPTPKSALIGTAFVEPRELGVLPPKFLFMIPLAEDSSPAKFQTGGPALCITTIGGGMFGQEEMNAISDLVDPLCLALTLMHCKNVSLDDNVPPDGLNKKHLKKSLRKIPLVTYKTIVIDPAKAVLKKEGGIEEYGLAKALHICRGHFKKFDENPLFGKVRGTFWWPAHARGTSEAGFAIRDYKIKI